MRGMVVRQPGPPSVFHCEEIPEPAMGSDDVVIEVHACGVCFHDVVCRNGTLKYGVELPIVPGHEVSGTVVAVGSAVSSFAAGDRVATLALRSTCGECLQCRRGFENLCPYRVLNGDRGLNGGYASRVTASSRLVSRIPDGVDMDSAALAGCAMGCQLNAVRDAGQVRTGETVLITGAAGGVGIHGIQLARISGARVLAVTSSETKAAALSQAGADEVLISPRGSDFSKDVMRLTDRRGVDVVIDNVGTPLYDQTRRSLGIGGRWVLVGQVNGDFAKFNPAQLFLRGISMISATGARKNHLDDCLTLLSLGRLRAIIHEAMPIEEATRAHEMMEQGTPLGRILLRA